MKDKIDEINKLDKARTQGEWSLPEKSYNMNRVICNLKTIADVRFKNGRNDAPFIAKAPSMVSIINQQQQMLETMATGIEIVLFTPDLPLMKCEINGLRNILTAYKQFMEGK